MENQDSAVSSPIPKNIFEDRLDRAGRKGLSLLWLFVPGFIILAGGTGGFFLWQYIRPALESGVLEKDLSHAILSGGIFFILAVSFAMRSLVSRYFLARKEARSAQFENEMFRLIVEGVNDGIWDWDVTKQEIYFSPRWLDMFGYRRGGIQNNPKAWLSLTHPDDMGSVEQALELHLSGQAPFFHAEYRMRTVGGEYKWVLSRGRAVFDKKKQPIRFSGSTTDISRLKSVEAALMGQAQELEKMNEEVKREKVKYQALLTSIGEGMIATDKEGKIIIMNDRGAEMLGTEASECTGKKFSDVLAIEENEKEEIIPISDRLFMKTLAGGAKVSSMVYYVRKDGTKFPAAVTSSPIVLDGETIGTIVVFRDITHEREVDKAKTEFVSLASHQLRTPLSAIRWYSEILVSEKIGPINEDQRTYLKEVYDSNRRMIDLVNALLNASRIDLGTFAVEPVETDIIQICDSVITELRVQTEAKGQSVDRKYEEGFPKVNVDPKLMRIILQNLLSNAVKYTPDRGQISVSIEKKEKNMLITVSDTGVGIPKEEQHRVFQKLFRADNARRVESEGTGLGLYIIKAIAEKSDGKVWFESEENQGTTFFIELPLSGMKAVHGAKDLA